MKKEKHKATLWYVKDWNREIWKEQRSKLKIFKRDMRDEIKKYMVLQEDLSRIKHVQVQNKTLKKLDLQPINETRVAETSEEYLVYTLTGETDHIIIRFLISTTD